MILFGFTLGACLLSHSIRLHIEHNTYNSWFNHSFNYDEDSNGFIVLFELCKVQVRLSVLSNAQDFWFDTAESYFVMHDHLTDEQLDELEREELEHKPSYKTAN